MNLSDFILLMNFCGNKVDDKWGEEDRGGINPLNVNPPPEKQYIGEEIKKI